MLTNLVQKMGLLGLGVAIGIMNSATIAQARDAGAGIGYDLGSDVSYCEAELRANDSNTRINVREGAGVDYSTRHYGRPGDAVDFLNRGKNVNEIMVEEDANGVSWYQVGFRETGAYGWVRNDFVRQTMCRN